MCSMFFNCCNPGIASFDCLVLLVDLVLVIIDFLDFIGVLACWIEQVKWKKNLTRLTKIRFEGGKFIKISKTIM